MITTVSRSGFIDTFKKSETYRNNFTYGGLEALFDYLEQLEGDTGTIEFDMVGICCDYSEYTTVLEAMEQYQPEDMPVEGVEGDDLVEITEKNEVKALEWLEDRTEVIKFDTGIIIRDF